MRALLRLLFALCGLSMLSHALDREAFTIAKYDLDLRIEPEQQRLGARGKITLRNDSSQPQKVVALQISSSLSWRSIRAAGKPLQFVSQPFTSDIDHTGGLSEAIVTLPAEVRPKDSVELEIGYEGVIVLDTTRLTRVGVPQEIARHTSWDQIGKSFTAVRGAGYVTWYPITTESADFSEGNSLFEVVDRWKAREAGSEMSVKACTAGRPDRRDHLFVGEEGVTWGSSHGGVVDEFCAVHHYAPVGPVAPTFVLATYHHAWTPPAPPLPIYYLDGHEAGAAIYSAEFEPASKFVTEWFGKPSAPIAIADLADSHAAPFESGTLLMVPMAGNDTELAGINLVHELTHSALESPRPWIYEGLAHFAEAVYREQQDGREAALELLGSHRAAFLDSENEVATSAQKNAGQPLITTFDETYYRSKAAYVWWMLRDMVGSDALKQAIHNYHAAEDTDPKYVEHLIESASKRDLSWFFDDWVYHDRGLPDFQVAAVHPWNGESEKTDKPVQMLTVTIENLGAAGAEVPFTIGCGESAVTNRLVVRAKSSATMRIELPCTAVEAVVNDGSVPESDLTNNGFRVPEPKSQ